MKRKKTPNRASKARVAKGAPEPSKDAPWEIHAFRRDSPPKGEEAAPALEFLRGCPEKVRGNFIRFVEAIAECPPHKFPPNDIFEAMHGDMKGIYKITVDDRQRREHYRLYVVLDANAWQHGLRRPSVVLLDGLSKPFFTKARDQDYERIRELRDEYLARKPRKTSAWETLLAALRELRVSE